MTNYFVKFAGMFALSAAAVTGISLAASDARAAEEEDHIAINAHNDAIDINEGTTGESAEAIDREWRGWYPGGLLRRRGYYSTPPYYYRYIYPHYRYFEPFHGIPLCGPYGCLR